MLTGARRKVSAVCCCFISRARLINGATVLITTQIGTAPRRNLHAQVVLSSGSVAFQQCSEGEGCFLLVGLLSSWLQRCWEENKTTTRELPKQLPASFLLSAEPRAVSGLIVVG